jgi:hypothetical protein
MHAMAMNKAQISKHLFSEAEKAAGRLKYVFHPGAAQDLNSLCDEAAASILKILTADPSISEEALVNMAEVVVVHFVDEMIAESRRIPGYALQNPGQLGEDTFKGALKRLCPIWPFC